VEGFSGRELRKASTGPPTRHRHFATFFSLVNIFQMGSRRSDSEILPFGLLTILEQQCLIPFESLAYVEAEGLGSSGLFRLFRLFGQEKESILSLRGTK
jgi:hypothetical protein